MRLAPGQTGLLRANASIRGGALRKWRAIGQFFETFPNCSEKGRLHNYRLQQEEKRCQRCVVFDEKLGILLTPGCSTRHDLPTSLVPELSRTSCNFIREMATGQSLIDRSEGECMTMSCNRIGPRHRLLLRVRFTTPAIDPCSICLGQPCGSSASIWAVLKLGFQVIPAENR